MICGPGTFQVTVRDALTGAIVDGPRTVTENTNVGGSLDWIAHFDEDPDPPRVDLHANTLYRIQFGSHIYMYYHCNEARPGYVAGSFTCPFSGVDPTPDVIFAYDENGMRVVPINLKGATNDQGITPYLGNYWIFPHYLDAICDQVNCGTVTGEQFPMFIAPAYDTNYRLPPFDLTVPVGADWTWESPYVTSLAFQPNTGLVVKDGLSVEGVTFKGFPACHPQCGGVLNPSGSAGWDGILVRGDDGSLDFDGVIVEGAEVGIEIRSGYGSIHTNTIYNTLLDGNGIGILADSHLNGLIGPARSSFDLRESCIVNSVFDDIEGLEGHGIWGRWTDAIILNTTVEDNDGYGVSFERADLFNAHGLLVTGNGAGSPSFNDGVRSGPYGDVTLASPFGGSGFEVGPDRNSIHDNAGDQIFIDQNGFATLGAGCGPTHCPDGNSVYGPFAQSGSYLIENLPSSTIPAERVFWDTSPPDPPDAAFLQPALVDDANPLSSDPASDAGRTLGCERSTFLDSGLGGGGGGSGGLGRSASAASRAVQAFGGGSGGEGRELDPETIAWLRGRIRAMRAALAENPAAEGAAVLLGRLYSLQRLDRTDLLGEHEATMGLLASLRARLAGEGPMPEALRATAEAALVAGVHDLMRGEDYEAARTVVAALWPRAELGRTRLAMALADASLDEVGGDYASAIGKYEGLIETLGPEHAQLARDLAATVALLEGRQNGGNLRMGNPMENRTGNTLAAQAAAEAGRAEAPSTFGLGSAYPNPFNPSTVVPFALDASADVRLSVYDVLGRRVARLAEGRYEAGTHTVRFDASALPSGTYLVRLTATPENGSAAQTFTERITLLR